MCAADDQLRRLRERNDLSVGVDLHRRRGHRNAEPHRRHTANANSAIFATTPTTKELRFYDLKASNTSQTIKFTFNRPVTNLAIQIVDIDQGNGTITGSPHIGIRRMSFTPSSC